MPSSAGLGHVSAPRSPARPLVISSDDDLLDDLLGLLAAADAEPVLSRGGPLLRRAHREAPLVLLGADCLQAPAVRELPRRPGVVVVGRGELPAAGWAAAVEVGAERVAMLPADEGWLVSRAAEALRAPHDGGWLVAVGGGCGGAGASTLAAALAVSAAPGVVLVDTDGWGAGLDLLLGAERDEGLRWPELAGLRGRVAGDALLASLPEVAGVHLLAAAREPATGPPADAVAAVIRAARAEGCPVVADLPRPGVDGPDASAHAVLAAADLALLVVPARLRAATAARLLVSADGSPWSSAELVVRPVSAGLSPSEVADVVGRPVFAELAHDRSAVVRGERGELPSVGARTPLGGVTRRVLARVAELR